MTPKKRQSFQTYCVLFSIKTKVAKIPDIPVTLPFRYKCREVAKEINNPPMNAITKSKQEAAPNNYYAIFKFINLKIYYFLKTLINYCNIIINII